MVRLASDRQPRRRRITAGQTLPLVAAGIATIIGATSLATDVAIFYYNELLLQKAADAAVLAGANYLPDNPDQAKTTAQTIAETDGIKASEIVSTTLGAGDSSISMTATRTVPYYFGKIFGFTTGTVSASATAAPQYPPSTVGAPNPSDVPSGGDSNGTTGTFGGSTGVYGLIPIGLDSHTTYSDGKVLVLQQGELGPGNWDLLALGGTGGSNLRTNIANGYSGPLSIGDWITTEPGKKVGPVDSGFQDRLDAAALSDPSGTATSHSLTDPRILIMPVVDWGSPNGRSQVQITAFATVWLDGYDPKGSGKVDVTFISQVVADSFGDPSAPFFGSRGNPILIK